MALIAPITCTIGNFQFMVLLYEYSQYSHKKNIVLVHLCWLKMAFCSLMLKSEGLKSTGVYKCDIYMYQPYMHPILENARAIVYDMSTSSFKTKYRIPYHTRQQKQNEGFANTTSVELLKYFNQAKIQWHRPIEKQWLWRLPELGISQTVYRHVEPCLHIFSDTYR